MDYFIVYESSFDGCLDNFDRVNLVLNFEKCHFMVEQGIILGNIISNKNIEVDQTMISVIT